MSKWFQYNQTLGKVELDETELLLIKEFRDLLDNNRNKSKTDPKGEHKERAFKEVQLRERVRLRAYPAHVRGIRP